MAVAASTVDAIAVASPPSSLFLRRSSSLAPTRFSFFLPRASSALRSAGFVFPVPHSSLHRPKSRPVATGAAESEPGEIKVEEESGGGEGEGVQEPGHGAGGGGGEGEGKSGGGGGHWEKSEAGEPNKENKSGMSMSQKLTLGYAALVGAGGIMGYIKRGSHKSLTAGMLAVFLLYCVYRELPVRPAFASFLGLGTSSALLAAMGARFMKSGKIFPAGLVSLVSLVMVGSYFHRIMCGLHV